MVVDEVKVIILGLKEIRSRPLICSLENELGNRVVVNGYEGRQHGLNLYIKKDGKWFKVIYAI